MVFTLKTPFLLLQKVKHWWLSPELAWVGCGGWGGTQAELLQAAVLLLYSWHCTTKCPAQCRAPLLISVLLRQVFFHEGPYSWRKQGIVCPLTLGGQCKGIFKTCCPSNSPFFLSYCIHLSAQVHRCSFFILFIIFSIAAQHMSELQKEPQLFCWFLTCAITFNLFMHSIILGNWVDAKCRLLCRVLSFILQWG